MISPFLQVATYLAPALALTVGLGVGMFVRRAVLPRLARFAAKSAWRWDDVILDAVSRPLVLWFALLGLHIALLLLPFSRTAHADLGRAVLVVFIFSVTWALARFAAGAVKARASRGALPGVSLIANIVRAVVFAVGILVILQGLGISITPVLTALGVGGLAVGLALQDTLSNFFSGIRILASGKIRPGDFIRLEGGLEGTVQDITWGQTTLRQPSNNLIIVPNAKLAQAITTNISLPAAELSVSVPVNVAYGSDLERVERVTLEVARAVQAEVPGALRGYEPAVLFGALGPVSVQMSVVLRASAWDQQSALISEFIKRLLARYAAEGIEIPHLTSGPAPQT